MPENLPARAEANDLATRFPILDPNLADEIRQVIEANIGPRGMSPQQFDRVKVPGSGGQMWIVQGIDGDEAHRELSGIVLAWTDSRLYYQVPFAERKGKGGPPDCSSVDSIYGVGDPGGRCEVCPMAAWGSDPKGGRGQACKQVRRLFFLRGDRILPEIITVPPTSLKNAQQYFSRLANFRIPYCGLITTLRLERTANADGMDYARILFSSAERFDDAQKAVLAPYQAQFMALLHKVDVDNEYDPQPHDHVDD